MHEPPPEARISRDDPPPEARISRDEARAVLGVTGADDAPPLMRTLREHGTGLYFVSALGLLAVVDNFMTQAFGVVAPEVSRSLGVDAGTLSAIVAAQSIAAGVGPLILAAALRRYPRRVRIALATAFGWSITTLFTGLVQGPAALTALMLINGVTTGAVAVLHPPLLMDAYPPPARVRVMSLYAASSPLAGILAPLLIAALAAWSGLDWRGVFIVLGALSLAAGLYAVGLKEPELGRWDALELTRRAGTGRVVEAEGLFRTLRRVFRVPSIRRMAVGFTAIGVLAVPYGIYVSTFLDSKWHLTVAERGLFTGAAAALTIVALVLFGNRAERAFQAGPSRFMRLSGGALAVAAAAFGLSTVAPTLWLVLSLLALGQALMAVVGPCLFTGALSVIRPADRPHAMAAIGLILAFGGLLGAGLLVLAELAVGIEGALTLLIVPAAAGSLFIATIHRTLMHDLDALINETIGESS
ncbi:MFS transporter [Sinosporangium siamense]|uniref:Major facilitator superfamily (MFS) profile domain-containing protein n=1 Tax=Sinosporangium siamense TaxID=1367973 RepID=A0A919VBA6_9ACTN|nr:MFS transporter [Sinosporangium siamense]GII91924.1 hypothetical protein Ssi02_21550 [Sinosporangium siamense]